MECARQWRNRRAEQSSWKHAGLCQVQVMTAEGLAGAGMPGDSLSGPAGLCYTYCTGCGTLAQNRKRDSCAINQEWRDVIPRETKAW